jgi:hypothetical protein
MSGIHDHRGDGVQVSGRRQGDGGEDENEEWAKTFHTGAETPQKPRGRRAEFAAGFPEVRAVPRLAFGERSVIFSQRSRVTPEAHEGDDSDFEDEAAWLRAVASNDVFAYLADPAEDIYTIDDGQPFRDSV